MCGWRCWSVECRELRRRTDSRAVGHGTEVATASSPGESSPAGRLPDVVKMSCSSVRWLVLAPVLLPPISPRTVYAPCFWLGLRSGPRRETGQRCPDGPRVEPYAATVGAWLPCSRTVCGPISLACFRRVSRRFPPSHHRTPERNGRPPLSNADPEPRNANRPLGVIRHRP